MSAPSSWVVRRAGRRGHRRPVGPDADAADLSLARRLKELPYLRAALAERRISVTVGKKLAAELVKVRPHLDRPDGSVDGLPGDEVVAGVVDGVVDLVCRDRLGLVVEDPA